jgi:hypothetical protein
MVLTGNGRGTAALPVLAKLTLLRSGPEQESNTLWLELKQ